MPYQLWSQDNFTKGEITPFLYARAQVNQYYEGLKKAVNVSSYPSGAAGKRWGTLFQAIITGDFLIREIALFTFEYLDECIYQLVFRKFAIEIYLEGILIHTVTPVATISPINYLSGPVIQNMSTTTIDRFFRCAFDGIDVAPQQLRREQDAVGQTITGVSGAEFQFAGPLTTGLVLPVRFTNLPLPPNPATPATPISSPAIRINITYFANITSSTTATIHHTAFEAKFGLNPIIPTAAAIGTILFPQNTWFFDFVPFKNFPFFDFGPSYDAINFTPGLITGITTLTATSAIFTTLHVGGAFFGNSGIAKIIAFTSPTVVTIAIQEPFVDTTAIHGSLAFLAEPAWSTTRGWPKKCSSYQSRAIFANTESLPNGIWLSVLNDYSDFANYTTDDDDAVSWYPTSNNINAIRFIVPYRSLSIHTNSGVYSTALSEIGAITPKTFSLQLQDTTPATILQPEAIDNQIILLSGNDAITMIWDGINNAYTTNIISIINEQTIRLPVDETAFVDHKRAGSRYVFVINTDGSLAAYQTLLSEAVSGWTPNITQSSLDAIASPSLFIQCASSSDGRCWFLVERTKLMLNAMNITNITAFNGGLFDNTVLTAIGSNIGAIPPAHISFTTTGSLPISIPQITTTQYYFGVAVDVDHFKVYLTNDEAVIGINPIVFSSAGVNSQVNYWTPGQSVILEELSHEVKLDCAVLYSGALTSTVTIDQFFNGQQVKMIGGQSLPNGNAALIGQGFGFDGTVFNGQVNFESHGSPVLVNTAYIGLPINMTIEPMPIAAPPGQQTSLTKPTHIRTVRFMFNNTIGGTINGVPIALKPFNMAMIGQPPQPANGIFEMGIMSGWDDFNQPSFTIMHNEPFDIQLLGVFYSVEI